MLTMKRCISLLLVLCLMISVAPVTAHAVTASGTCGYLTWSLSDDGVLTISGNSHMGYVNSISGEIADFYVKNPWKDVKDSIQTVIIEDGVTSICGYAFWGFENLQSVNIGNGVTNIAMSAFNDCASLMEICVDDSNGYYCDIDGVLYNKAMTELFCCPEGMQGSVTVPASVTNIASYAFENCCGLTAIFVDESNTTYCDDNGVLWSKDMESLIYYPGKKQGSITISDKVTSISEYAFDGSDGLTEIYVDDDNSTYSDIDGILYNKDATVLIRCPEGKEGSLAIPDGVTSLRTYAFSSCEKMTDIKIPAGISEIDEGNFIGCTELTSIEIPASVTKIDRYAFADCTNLESIYFSADAPDFVGWGYVDNVLGLVSDPGNDTQFRGVTATVYYPADNATWTARVMTDYGGTITWVPYTPENIDPPATSVDTHDTLDQLTELDYLAFAKIAYEDFDDYEGDTLEAVLIDKGIWSKKFEKTDILYSELCESIANWKVADIWDFSDVSGFYGVAFENGNGEAVISYRGSVPLGGLNDLGTDDAIDDWLVNDLPSELFDVVINDGQYLDAIAMYESVLYHYPTVAVTGHSLGGGLADLVSAHFGCKGVTMNAIAILDTIYTKDPMLYAKSFEGVDKWNFVDHANQHDKLAGSFENTFSTKIKPVVAHRNNSGDFTIKNIVEYHGLGSYVTRDSGGNPSLQDVVYTFTPNSVISNHMNAFVGSIDLGTSKADRIDKGLSVLTSRTTYGGNGADTLLSSVWGDTLIGGNGNDTLDGNRGSDTYYYCKGDGVDTIHDIGGDDVLYLLGFDEEDSFSISEEYGSAYINVVCNGETIVKISKKNREHVLFTTDSFNIVVDYEIDGHNPKVFDITDRFSTSIYGQRVLVACPVHVEILDPDGNVVHTLTDGEIGTWYTEYGNFYVFEEENGEYGKVLDLVEGYTARIMGAGEGTMDVTYQVPVDGELSDPVSVSGVPVTENLSATIEENEDGNVYLVIDEDNDGETDSERRLCGECPFTDVPKDSFYYEPVLWAVKEGITNGATETTYNPNGTCLRAQVVTFLHRADGNPEPTSMRNPFTDVKSGDFFYKPVLWAVEKGITNGTTATTFGSYANCNRAAVVTFLWRAAGSPEPKTTDNPFTDVESSDFFYKPVLWAIENGITTGVDATHFGPTSPCNRAQVVTFLYRTYN